MCRSLRILSHASYAEAWDWHCYFYLDKCHLNISDTENAKNKLDGFTITNSKKEKLRGIIFDDKLKFRYYIEN